MYHDILKSDLQMASCMSEKMTVLLQEENNLFLYILFLQIPQIVPQIPVMICLFLLSVYFLVEFIRVFIKRYKGINLTVIHLLNHFSTLLLWIVAKYIFSAFKLKENQV